MDLSHIASGITQYGEGLVHCYSGLEECNTDRLLMLVIHSDCLGSWVFGCLCFEPSQIFADQEGGIGQQ